MIKIVTQNHNDEYRISRVKIEVNSTCTYDILGYNICTSEYVWLGTYINLIDANEIVAAILKQKFVQFRGGSEYNIFEMPYDKY
jgi:hypothetical protein